MPRRAFLFSLLFTSVFAARAASVNCALARTLRDKAVCASADLSALDNKLQASYTHLRSVLSPAASALVQQDQRAWLQYLDVFCSTASLNRGDPGKCFTAQYRQRLPELTATTLPSGQQLYSRRVVVIVPSQKPAHGRPGGDPGFGRGDFSFPQIDSPSAEALAFNRTSEQIARGLATPPDKGAATSFKEAVTPDGEADITWKLINRNQRLLTLGLQSLFYGYGGAHPSTTRRYLSWWLQQGRELTADDVFGPTSGWKTALVGPVTRKLDENPALHGHIWDGKPFPSGVPKGIARTRSWTLNKQCLVFNFDQYEVAAYYFGMPSACVPWADLRPLLSPDLHPETLPDAPPAEP